MFNESTWKSGELLAQEYMKNNGYKILLTNFSCVGVELDIVALLPKKIQIKKLKDEYKQKILFDKKNKVIYKNSLKNQIKTIDDLLVVTEVKARRGESFGKGAEFINDSKKNNIIRGARFLQQDAKFAKYQMRFDVASVDNDEICYIESAF